ncbi:Protein O-mannosyl-transferase 1 [Lamellibrachia satsuma]|nr:Protein O-mannosyl-transferase 1 [Lamellibrachia satsuma]
MEEDSTQSTENEAVRAALMEGMSAARDKGGTVPDRWTETARTETAGPTKESDSSQSFTFHANIDLIQWLLFLVAMATRMWRLDHPHGVVFDELHYGRFTAMYLQRRFFFDQHPPLGKLLLTLGACLCGFDGEYKFERIGADYTPDVPVFCMRMMPALFGCLLVPVVYQLIVELNLTRWTAVLASCLIIFDNALLTQTRFMLMESFLIFFVILSLLSLVKFTKLNRRCPFSMQWWAWLALLGVSMTCAVSVKYIGVMMAVLVLLLTGRDYWQMLADLRLSDVQLMRHLLARVGFLLVVPVGVYLSIFYVHLSILTKAGPHDDIMTSAFQASLEGGLAAITKGQPFEVAYGSQVTLRHTHSSRPCWLHSHPQVYPLRYPDGRGSSHQQQVTCYFYKDVNNWWIIKDPNRASLMVDDPVRPVKHGDIVQLIHGTTSRALNSHDVAAPLSPEQQEVTCYIDYNISIPAQSLWRVEILNHDTEGDTWKTIRSQVHLKHLNTSQALKISGKQLPEWGFHQLEVVTDNLHDHTASLWNVEEHRYTRSKSLSSHNKA